MLRYLPPTWRVRLGVRTPASQAGNTGSNPVRATIPSFSLSRDSPSGFGRFGFALRARLQGANTSAVERGGAAWRVEPGTEALAAQPVLYVLASVLREASGQTGDAFLPEQIRWPRVTVSNPGCAVISSNEVRAGGEAGTMKLRAVAGWRSTLILGVVLVHGIALALPSAAASPTLGELAVVGHGPTTLLVVPCASCRWRSFESFAERNAERFTTVAVTLPGYGGTPLPDLPRWSRDGAWHGHALQALENLLDDLDLPAVIVAGHSFGSSIALQLADRRPDRIRALVNLDGTLAGPLDRGDESPAERLAAAERIRREYMDPLDDLDAWQAFNLPKIANEERRTVYHGWFMATDRVAVTQYWWDNLFLDRNAILERLEIPVLDVQLYGPTARNPAAARERYEARLEALELGSRYEVRFHEHTGHFVMEDDPDLLDALLVDFADRLASAEDGFP